MMAFRSTCQLVCALLGAVLVFVGVPPASDAGAALSALRVDGNRLVDTYGQHVVLHGVNRAGMEYMCAQDRGIADGPIDQASIDAIRSWRTNAVRVPLNEHCWLGIDDGAPTPAYVGEPYRRTVEDFVGRLVANGLYVILDLHWTAPAGQPADGLMPMPNTSYSAEFWRSVATRFQGNGMVIFDLFNEPVPNDNVNDATETAARRSWECWRDGGTASCNASFSLGTPGTAMTASETIGMQGLVDAVRSTGATNLIIVGGIQWANTLWSSAAHNWLSYKPVDPIGNLAASEHIHGNNWCVTIACYDTEIAPVAAVVPVVTGEVGIAGCDAAAATWLTSLLGWLDARQIGHLGWTWNTVGPGQDPCRVRKLVSDYGGTATPYGEIYRAYLASLPVGTTTTLASSAASPSEGEPVTFTATVTGAFGPGVPQGSVVFAVDGSESTATLNGDGRASATVVFADDGIRQVVARYVATAGFAPSASPPLTQVVANVAPTTGAIKGVEVPVSVGTVLTITAAFSDPGTADTHVGHVQWGDGAAAAAINELAGSGTLSASHDYRAAGIYTVAVTVTDDDGGAGASVAETVVVFDPTAGSLRGAGWFESPVGAHLSEPAAAGRVTFGVLARYGDDATPSTHPGFRLKTGRFSFESTSHQWLVVTEAKAQLHGTGRVNGSGTYGFHLSAIDGKVLGPDEVDRIRVKIWDIATGAVLYDTQVDAAEGADPLSDLGGGRISVGR